MKKYILLIILFFLTGCKTSGYFINDSPLNITEIRKIVNAVIGKPRSVSLNGREMFSDYHDKQFQPFQEDPAKTPNRYSTMVVILGPRRPYEINVIVYVDQYDAETKSYVRTGVDDDLSRKRAIVIKKTLNLSLAKKSGFDGDNPF